MSNATFALNSVINNKKRTTGTAQDACLKLIQSSRATHNLQIQLTKEMKHIEHQANRASKTSNNSTDLQPILKHAMLCSTANVFPPSDRPMKHTDFLDYSPRKVIGFSSSSPMTVKQKFRAF